MSSNFDVVVIGSGPGGYAAAIRCAQKGAVTAMVEKEFIGGTCLNRGCIPSKVLLGSAHFLAIAKHAGLMGVEIGPVKPNWEKMQSRKNAIVEGFRRGLTGLVQSNRIQIFNGRGIVAQPGRITVLADGRNTELAAKNIILATGSQPVQIPAFPFDGQTIISSTEALSLPAIPQSMVIIGGGVIGCELGCVYGCLGSRVTIIEMLPTILPNEDRWVGELMARELKKVGIETLTAQKVTEIRTTGTMAKAVLEDGRTIDAEKVLVAVGRAAFCDKETIDALGLKTSGKRIDVNEKMQAGAAGVWAIGDAVGTTYLAHGAFSEAEVAAANATGGNESIGDYSLIPRAVYTFPEVASVGMNEAACAKAGIEFETGKAAFRSNGRSLAHNETAGEVRVLRQKDSRRILGVTIVGSTATEMIATARALIGSTEKISEVCFAHPTVSEVLKEAWEDAFGISLHVPPGK